MLVETEHAVMSNLNNYSYICYITGSYCFIWKLHTQFQIETIDRLTNLTIYKAHPEDTGMITCRAKNIAGTAECSAELYVQGKSSVSSVCLKSAAIILCYTYKWTHLQLIISASLVQNLLLTCKGLEYFSIFSWGFVLSLSFHWIAKPWPAIFICAFHNIHVIHSYYRDI